MRALPGVEDVVVNLVWEPMWSPDRMEPRIKAYLASERRIAFSQWGIYRYFKELDG